MFENSETIGRSAAGAGTLRIWVVTDGRAGNENPAKALAEGVAEAAGGAEISIKRLDLRPGAALLPAPWWLAAPARLGGWPFLALRDGGAALRPPFPDLAIGAGRRSAPFIVAIRALSRRAGATGPGTIAAQILDPKLRPSRFDLLIAPAHDAPPKDEPPEETARRLAVIGSIHGVDDQAPSARDPRLARLGRPLIGLLIGGSSRSATMRIEDADRLLDALRPALAAGAGLAATASRRTPKAIVERLTPEICGLGGFFWDGEGENPYRAILAEADALVATADSVNMASEAAGTGKPVFIAPIAKLSPKLERFHAALRKGGHAAPLPDRLELGTLAQARPVRLDDRAAAAERIRALLAARDGI